MNNNRKILIKLFAVLVLLLIASTAFGANGDTINIGGVVPLELNLTVAPTAAADNLTLVAGSTTAANVSIALISIATNNTAGYELWIYSVNEGSIDNADTDPIEYTLSYGGNLGTAPATQKPTAAGLKFGENTSATAETDQTLTINYSQEPDYPAGYYSDQLTLVLRAK